VRRGVLYPLVAIGVGDYVVAEPSRTLLLFAEWIVHALHDTSGDPVLSSYIDATARELTRV
jgi:hypothetical protein